MAAKLQNLDQNLSAAGLLAVRDQRGRKTERPAAGRAKFLRLLQKQEGATAGVGATERGEQLRDCLEQVTRAGRRLQQAPSYSALREYRSSVQGFLQQSLAALYQTEEVLGRLNYSTGQRKKYCLIQVIDEKLEQLVRAVLNEQRANLEILRRIEEINGLLVDLLY